MPTHNPKRSINARRAENSPIPRTSDVFYCIAESLVLNRRGELWLDLTLPMSDMLSKDFVLKCSSLNLATDFKVEVDQQSFDDLGLIAIRTQVSPERQRDKHQLEKFAAITLTTIPV